MNLEQRVPAVRAPRLALSLIAARSWVTATADRRALARVLGVFLLTRLALFIYTAGAVGVGILFAPESVGRELLAAVPAFAVTGAADHGTLDEGLRLLSFGVLAILLVAFATWHFVG